MSYATLAQTKQYLGIAGTGDDALLTRLLDAASAMIDARCARTFSASTASKRHNANMSVGRDLVLLDDLRSISTVTTDQSQTLVATDFVAFDAPTRVLRLSDTAPALDARDWFIVTGTWGYMQSPSADIEQTCVRLAAWLYRQKDAQTFDLTGVAQAGQMFVQSRIPPDIDAMLRQYVVSGVLVL
jgi:hypothetical protein